MGVTGISTKMECRCERHSNMLTSRERMTLSTGSAFRSEKKRNVTICTREAQAASQRLTSQPHLSPKLSAVLIKFARCY